MIGKLKGLIDSYGEDFVILDVNGVGYVVQCSSRTLQKLPKVGEAASLAIETQVREDAIRLFGFTSDSERDWFRLLQSVQGLILRFHAVARSLGPGAPARDALDAVLPGWVRAALPQPAISSVIAVFLGVVGVVYGILTRGEAVGLLVEYGFTKLNLRRVYLRVHARNERAIRAYRACGFVEEGRLRQHVWSDGAYDDLLYMAILRK